jgi:hypothetical protein
LSDSGSTPWCPSAIGRQLAPGALEGLDQVALVERDDRRDALGLRRDQRARQLVLGELGLGRDQDQHLVQVGGEGLGADLVLPVEEVARGSTSSMVPSSSVACQRTRSPTTAWLFLPRGWQMRRSPVGRFDQAVAPVAGDDEAVVVRLPRVVQRG